MDLDEDGYRDILSGSYSRMGQPMAGLFQVLWGQEDGTFRLAEALTGADGQPLEIPPGDDAAQNSGVSLETICTRPTAVDWDDDGDLDLVVGTFAGSFHLFLGEGGGQFQPEPKQIVSRDAPLKIQGAHSDPFIVDWDQDGDLDLLSGSSHGGVQWAENTAGAGALPAFDSFQTLIPAGAGIEYGQLLKESDLTGPTSSTRIWVDDVNDDGKLDVLVGDNVTLVSPADGLSEAEYREKLAAWTEQLQEANEKVMALREQPVAGDDADAPQSGIGNLLRSWFGWGTPSSEMEQAQTQLSNLYQERSKFMKGESTGFVWLYLQE